MPIVTLTTDFGHKDFSVSVIKGALIQQISNVTIIDISHEISPYNPSETAYILKNAFRSFPNGSIHIIGVESEWTPENSHLVMEFEEHYFISSDNGVLSLIKEDLNASKIVEINIHKKVISAFPVLDVFINVAAHIARKGKLEVIGKSITDIKELTNIKPVINKDKNQILGSVIYIDNYGNLVTSIKESLFYEVGKSRSFTIFARSIKFKNIYKSYSQAIDFNLPKGKREEDGKKIALFNTAGHLELAVYKSNPLTVGGAGSLFGLGYRDPVTIQFD
ncbi:MAG: S-adenosyl-l-methionine hydroxide adenosyltransferase family protein [Flavobacteriaceae bacterium]|tara:strand:- start:3735 stop:4565 length:831 start_codon:yes stop_codon:yes gene_type:complete